MVLIADLLHVQEASSKCEFGHSLGLCSELERLVITGISPYLASTMDIEIIELVDPTKNVKLEMQMHWQKGKKIWLTITPQKR